MAGCTGGGSHHWILDDYPTAGRYLCACRKCAERASFPVDEVGTVKTSRAVKVRRHHGYILHDRALMAQRSGEYRERKPELIDLHIKLGGSHRLTARASAIPFSTMRTLITRWDKDIQKRRKEMEAKSSSITGTLVSVRREDAQVVAVVELVAGTLVSVGGETMELPAPCMIHLALGIY